MRAVEHAIETLLGWGTSAVFGNPGSSELPFLNELPPSIPYLLTLQESVAVAAGTGYAMASGRPGVVSLHGMPGVGHAVGAISGAARARAPIVIIAGLPDSRHLARRPHLSGPVAAVLSPLVRWSTVVDRAEDVPEAIEQAFRWASGPPSGPAFVAVPMDLWDRPSRAAVRLDTSVDDGVPVLPSWLVARIAGARRPALLVGGGVEDRASWDALIGFAERQGAAVYGVPLASMVGFPTAHPSFRGHLGLSHASIRSALDGHDLILVLSEEPPAAYAYSDGPMFPPGADVVVLAGSAEASSGVEATRRVLGPPARLALALGRLPAREGSVAVVEGDRVASPGGTARGDLLDWERVFEAVARHIPPDSIVVDEAMTLAPILRRVVPTRSPRTSLRTPGGSLGFSVGAAIGAQVASPERTVTAFVGDGGLMYAPQALWTAARYRLPVKVVVLDNGGYESLRSYVRESGMQLSGNVDLAVRGIDHRALAASLGVPGSFADDLRSLEDGLERLYAEPGPGLLAVRVDGTTPR